MCRKTVSSMDKLGRAPFHFSLVLLVFLPIVFVRFCYSSQLILLSSCVCCVYFSWSFDSIWSNQQANHVNQNENYLDEMFANAVSSSCRRHWLNIVLHMDNNTFFFIVKNAIIGMITEKINRLRKLRHN